MRFRFRPEIMESFTDILKSDEMSNRLARIGNEDLSAVESYVRFNDIITESLLKVDSIHKKVVAKEPQAGTFSNVPVNSWYDEDCRILRNELRKVENESGTNSHAANAARSRYRTLTRRLRREHNDLKAKSLIDKLKSNPRLFWKQYKGSSKKCPLMNVEEWAKYFASTFQSSELGVWDVAEASPADIETASSLNIPITEAEVYAELLKLQRNKAVGVDGIPAEFYIPIKSDHKGKFPFFPPTQNILVPVLTKLFNHILIDDYPSQCADSAITPIPKSKGSLTEFDNYRGIAVGSVLPKILSMILNTRGNNWAEANNKRAVGQFGFRQGKSTLDAAFILRHTLEVYQSRKKPVYCAFIDFRKAYDSVNRNILWSCLERMGLHGNYMSTLKNMYREVRMRVRVGNSISEAFLAEAGVKQGDNLSPLLFGLFIDQVEKYFTDKCGDEEGIRIADNFCRVILYADDLAILSESPEGLQNMLKHLDDFCNTYKMVVNTAKSAVVVFNSNFLAGKIPNTWYFKGMELPIKKEFVYLGILFVGDHGRKGGTHKAGDRQLATANSATHALWKRCIEIDLANPKTVSYLYGTLIQPILNYGCEVWATDQLGNIDTSHGLVSKYETIHTKFLKRALGVRDSTSNNLVLNELNRSPTWTQWLKQCVGFWNKIVVRKDDDFVKKAMVENVRMAVTGNCKHCWSHGFLSCIQSLGVIESFSDVLMDNFSLSKVDPKMIDDSITKIVAINWQVLESRNPRNHDDQGAGIKSVTYAKWMRSLHEDSYCTSFTRLLNNRKDITCIARLRLRAHNLIVESDRDVPRSSRYCRCCEMVTNGRKAVEDELHFILECPLYTAERKELFAKLRLESEFDDKDLQMRRVMNPTSVEGWKYLVKFINKCDEKRKCKLLM